MANEVRLIDAKFAQHIANNELNSDESGVVQWVLSHTPTIEPESLRPKGRWEKYWCETDLIGHMYEVCQNCLSCEILDTDKFWDSNYCPNCGAKMEG